MTDPRLDAVSAAAAEAGRMAHELWRGDFKRWEKAPGNPVCEVDLAVDDFLRARLAQIDPEAGWLSEETADSAERLLRSKAWVVDPIDGTRDYIRGRTGWAVSVALVEGGKVLLGVLDAPSRGQQWCAEMGGGAWLNGERLRVSDREELPGARVPADTLPKTDADLIGVPRPNSIALRIGMIAAGEVDLVATLRWGREWDIAAAHLIAQEAGAIVTDALGRPIRFNSTSAEAFGVLASVPGIHQAAVQRLWSRAMKASAR
ncbi:3'(2'),5'-bisphosphate nucleotidase CysQ [Sphingomonas sp. ID1715]|uniref:inositol monophosphatase family protein n=1 Tax=Sphingomonas sp. ID1715 TaxID=1656898 RepID=UPI001489AFD0|nr:3'(2'),5'-bisphosphate nucleotidase CysQ [Sphingomonas sp. ID1715]